MRAAWFSDHGSTLDLMSGERRHYVQRLGGGEKGGEVAFGIRSRAFIPWWKPAERIGL